MMNRKAGKNYWESFYRSARVPAIPSQFAVFVLGELGGSKAFVDVGCGTGRDSFFFLSQGYKTIGIDQSASAIEVCNKKKKDEGVNGAIFLQMSVDDPEFSETVLRNLRNLGVDGPITIYSRFFIHAITEEVEQKFLNSCMNVLKDIGGYLALEFRTIRDKLQPKVTPQHYRRYVDPHEFFARAVNVGYNPVYFIEGFGFAKYKDDDAHVARFIFSIE